MYLLRKASSRLCWRGINQMGSNPRMNPQRAPHHWAVWAHFLPTSALHWPRGPSSFYLYFGLGVRGVSLFVIISACPRPFGTRAPLHQWITKKKREIGWVMCSTLRKPVKMGLWTFSDSSPSLTASIFVSTERLIEKVSHGICV